MCLDLLYLAVGVFVVVVKVPSAATRKRDRRHTKTVIVGEHRYGTPPSTYYYKMESAVNSLILAFSR